MKFNKKILMVSLLVVAVGLVTWKVMSSRSALDQRRQMIPIVQTERPRKESVVRKLVMTGDILPIQQANIYSRVSGNLSRIFVDIGSTVREHQLLALIDTTELAQQVLQTSAIYENARLNYERNKDLYSQNLVAQQDLDNALAASRVASANYEQARIRLAYAHITAPFSGHITKRFLDEGANVTSNDKILFTLMDAGVMKMSVNVLEKDIPFIAAGKKAMITVDAYPDKKFYGSITRYSSAVDLATRTMEVEIDIPNRDQLLKPGMFANVDIIVDEHKDALTVPTQALLKDDSGYFVFGVDGNTSRRIAVRAGIEQNARTEILAGLNGAENIVTVGQQFVKDGSQVIIQQ